MPVEIIINGENAQQALGELRHFAGGLLGVQSSKGVGGADKFPPVPVEGEAAAAGSEPEITVQQTEPAKRGRKPKATVTDVVDQNEKTAISTGEERVDPNAGKPPVAEEKPLTLDDVRNAAGGYVKKFGMEYAQVDVLKIIQSVIGPDAVNISSLTGHPEATLQSVIDDIDKAIADGKRYEPASVL